MHPLERADIDTEGKEDLFGLFSHIGKSEASGDMDNSHVDADLKTTSVRLREPQLKALDAVLKEFRITRNDAFAYAITQFMADAINGYAFGRAEAIGYKNFEQGASDERQALLESLGLDDETRKYLSNLTKYEFLKRLGVE